MMKLPPNARLTPFLRRTPLLFRPQLPSRRLLSDKPTYRPRPTLTTKLPGVPETPLQDFTIPRKPKVPLGGTPETPVTLRIAGQRLRSWAWWKGFFYLLRRMFIPIVLFELGLSTSLFCIHYVVLKHHDDIDPTPKSWTWWARYCVLRARAHYPMIPNFGTPQTDDDVEYWLDHALEEVQEKVKMRGGWGAESLDEEFIVGMLKLRLERARFYQTVREDYKSEGRELFEALGVPVKDGVAVKERVDAAVRLARVLEWEGEDTLALDVLRGAIGIAYPKIRDTEKGGEVPMPPELNRRLPSMGSIENSPALMDSVSELGMFFGRHGDSMMALELLTEVLMRRKKGPQVFDPADPSAGDKISDPCKVAAAMAGVGELMFSIGKKMEGLAWEEKAFMESRELAHYRKACKDCAGVAAKNLIQMGSLLVEEAEQAEKDGKGWFWKDNTKNAIDFTKRDAEMLVGVYEQELKHILSIRAVKDNEELMPTK